MIRLPRHAASCPVGIGVSCSADRNIKAKITKEGIWLEKLEDNPGRFIPEKYRQAGDAGGVKINLNRPIKEVLAELGKYPVSTRLSLNGTVIVARDIAHAKLKERLDKGEDLPQYFKDHPIFMQVRRKHLRDIFRARWGLRHLIAWIHMSKSSNRVEVV